ncbi:adiponectin [Callorhinchus milii]|uniref:Adiponectin, C1Q and collagen domain containing, b n=1 Tax=Callorhinchus milii TaxID=7868 RepID=V9KXJ6_CALMI|nr:adiponectin [Callorhinchus milii]|eukprot:gi/632934629/ref/XP_007885717.1/ PREDICTED: adiponectin-like [Callorhinchus milii]
MKMLLKQLILLVVMVGLNCSENGEPEEPESEPNDESPDSPELPVAPATQPQASPTVIQGCPNWMAGIPGNPGHNGIPGKDGRDGRDGTKGDKGDEGQQGPKGDDGEPGASGVDGVEGLPGTPGRKGDKGESGYSYRSAFSVGLTSINPIPNIPIKFTKIFYNREKHYDEETGKFTSPFAGIYFFSYHLTVYTKDVKVGLYKNSKAIVFTYDQFQNNDLDQAGGSVTIHLDAGDSVWLQVYGDNTFNGIYADNNNDSMFTGFLLYPDLY